MRYEALTAAEWERIESEEHDRVYAGSRPFFFADDRIDPELVLRWEDYCYKPGRRKDRGHRTKRLFELMGVPHLDGKRVLDIGCGTGQYAVLFAMFGADVDAFDISPVGVQHGQRFAAANGVSENCRIKVGTASSMDYADESFDIIVLHEVLHHIIKYPNVHAEILRVLKPGGMVVCADALKGHGLLDLARKISMRGEEAKGDVLLSIADFETFARGFSSFRLETMSLLFMAKRLFERRLEHAPVRALLRLLKGTDDVLLGAFPGLQRYCGECVAVFTK